MKLEYKKYLTKYGKYIIPLLVGIILYFVNSNFLQYLFAAYPKTLMWTFGKGGWWVFQTPLIKILYVGIVAPVFEEIVFRQGIFGTLKNMNKFYLGLIISSLLFGFWHMIIGWGILKALDMTLVGIIFALVYNKYGFRGSLISHLTNNALALYFMLSI